ncbi:hypothetical protein DRE_02935 [Drechslerella stenobrocha 248]|uniref:Uncharacterized protein n=1 Tax=Drechslerella stenobrocha 248 TaxID=1043628 RepID=W7IF74_9PEZI|nr:hypothetical protein DRE_02935 [Drechslerella stenobrocha 248]
MANPATLSPEREIEEIPSQNTFIIDSDDEAQAPANTTSTYDPNMVKSLLGDLLTEYIAKHNLLDLTNEELEKVDFSDPLSMSRVEPLADIPENRWAAFLGVKFPTVDESNLRGSYPWEQNVEKFVRQPSPTYYKSPRDAMVALGHESAPGAFGGPSSVDALRLLQKEEYRRYRTGEQRDGGFPNTEQRLDMAGQSQSYNDYNSEDYGEKYVGRNAGFVKKPVPTAKDMMTTFMSANEAETLEEQAVDDFRFEDFFNFDAYYNDTPDQGASNKRPVPDDFDQKQSGDSGDDSKRPRLS